MIKFFRKIRQQLLQENRFSKYLLYAIGEIILVVIGILIALQINTWNGNRKQQAKEISYLKDIKTNLEDDLLSLQSVIDFNTEKSILVDSMFLTFQESNDPKKYMPPVLRYMFTISSYDVFLPNKTAFDNMVASENIDLVSGLKLRNLLSQYYKKDFVSTTQESVKERTRQFSDYIGIVGFNKQSIEALTSYESSLQDISEVALHQDSQMYAYLFSMLMSTQSQSTTLEEIKVEIQQLIELINQQIQLP